MSLADVLFRVPWPSYLFLLISIFTLPLYILLLVIIANKRGKFQRFRSTYYNLVLAQGIVDILAMFLYSTTYIPRAFGVARDLYWNYRDFIAPFSFNHSMFFLIVRCYEDALMSVQRFHVVCRRNNNPQRLQWIRLPNVLLASWLPPSLLSLPIVIHWPQTFDTREGLSMVTPAAHQKFCDIYQIVFQLVTFSISLAAYSNVLRSILSTKSTRTVTREIRLSFVAMGQVLGFLMVVVYHILQYLVVEYDMKEAVRDIRTYFPIITGFESYINPWLHLSLNKDLRSELLYLWHGGSQGRPSNSRSANIRSGRPRRKSNEVLPLE